MYLISPWLRPGEIFFAIFCLQFLFAIIFANGVPQTDKLLTCADCSENE
jgi:hypothetical protein